MIHPRAPQPSRSLCLNRSDYAFNTEYMKLRLLKKELVLVFLSKYSIAQSSTTTELYSRNAVLFNWILWMRTFNVTSIMYISALYFMGQARECIQHPGMQKLVLILPSLTSKICLNHGDMSSSKPWPTHGSLHWCNSVEDECKTGSVAIAKLPSTICFLVCRSDSSDAVKLAWKTKSRIRRINS